MPERTWEELCFFPKLPYRNVIGPWNATAEATLLRWLSYHPDVEIKRVKRIVTRRPQYYDYDLAAIVRAKVRQVRLTTGCDADIVVDAAVGMHMSNTGNIYAGMWYGREVMLVTQRCHEGHLEHFASWRLEDFLTRLTVRSRIIEALGNRWSEQERHRVAFNKLAALAR